MRNNKGFSLVELIVVIAIMAILAAVAIPTFAGFINKANVAADISFMNDVEYAAELAFAAQDKDITKIVVVLAEDQGLPTSVKVYFDATTFVEIKETGNTNNDKAIETAMNDIAATIDWKYDFKAKIEKIEANQNWPAATAPTTWDLTTGS